MLTSQDYKQLAERCAELASECSAPRVAEALRALVVEYFARAASLRRRETAAAARPMGPRAHQRNGGAQALGRWAVTRGWGRFYYLMPNGPKAIRAALKS